MVFFYGFIGALVLIYIGYAIVDRWRKGKRSKTFQEVAQELGLQYIPRDSSRRNSYRFLDEIPGADRVSEGGMLHDWRL